MRKVIKISVLVALMMLMLGTVLNAQVLARPYEFTIDKGHCSYDRFPTPGELHVQVWLVTPYGLISIRDFLTKDSGSHRYSFPDDLSLALRATGLRIRVTRKFDNTYIEKELPVTSNLIFDSFIFPFKDTVPPHIHY